MDFSKCQRVGVTHPYVVQGWMVIVLYVLILHYEDAEGEEETPFPKGQRKKRLRHCRQEKDRLILNYLLTFINI